MEPLDVRRTRAAESNVAEPVRETASQTAGPYVHIGCLPNESGISGVYAEDLTSNTVVDVNDVIAIRGCVYDGDGEACKDVLMEFWQPDPSGDFGNGVWQRCATDPETGHYEIRTTMPGSFQTEQAENLAPFLSIWVVARGINLGLLTRLYFSESAAEIAKDPHLALVPADRRHTLIAERDEHSSGYVFNIHLQGERETVFFET